MRKEFKGDFLSFSFNNINSSEMGIVRVDDGSRFNQDLLPPSNERSIDMAGRSETFFIDSWYTPRERTVEFAFDSLTEYDLHRLTRWLAADEVGELIFDENDYKYYKVRVVNNVDISYVPFDAPETVVNSMGKTVLPRIYKGEGVIAFKAYFPFAINKYGTITEDNVEQWSKASGLKYTNEFGEFMYDRPNAQGVAKLYNAGDVKTPINIEFIPLETNGYQTFTLQENGNTIGQAVIDMSKLNINDTYVLDSYRQLVRPKHSDDDTNDAIVAGDFLYLPPSVDFQTGVEKQHELLTNPSISPGAAGAKIELRDQGINYKYLYY